MRILAAEEVVLPLLHIYAGFKDAVLPTIKVSIRARKMYPIDQNETVRSAAEGAKETGSGLGVGSRLGVGVGVGIDRDYARKCSCTRCSASIRSATCS